MKISPILSVIILILAGIIVWRVQVCVCRSEGFETDCTSKCNSQWVDCNKRDGSDCGVMHDQCLKACG